MVLNFRNRWERRVRDYCDSQYELIAVTSGDINFYYKCHLISTHYAINEGHEKLALIVSRDKKNLLPVVHFVNYDGEKFIDNSLGCWSRDQEYRFIRWVGKDEFWDTPTILTDTKKFFSNMASVFVKKFWNISN